MVVDGENKEQDKLRLAMLFLFTVRRLDEEEKTSAEIKHRNYDFNMTSACRIESITDDKMSVYVSKCF